MTNDEIGNNAGRVWKVLNNGGCWTAEELKEKTGLSAKELWTAIGWLARENQLVFDRIGKEDRFYLRYCRY